MSKQKWGNAVWFTFHTLAEKLRPEFSHEAPLLLNYFKGICASLPCPSCSHHAQQNMKQMNTKRVVNKNSFIHFMWEFHNVVNSQLRRPFYTIGQCRNQYKYAVTYNMIKNFKRYMTIPSGHPKLMVDGQNRLRAVNALLYYLQYNLYKFYP